MLACFRPLALAAVLIAVGLTSPARLNAAPPDKRPMKLDDMFAIKRVAAPQISPDGKAVVYQVTTVNFEANKTSAALWLAATDAKTPPKQLTDSKGKKDLSPRWSPNGKQILFESNRSGSMQLWVVSAEGGEPKQLTDISTGAGTLFWLMLFTEARCIRITSRNGSRFRYQPGHAPPGMAAASVVPRRCCKSSVAGASGWHSSAMRDDCR